MKKRKTTVAFTCCLFICICYGYLCLNPIVIDRPYIQNEFLSSHLFNPIKKMNFTIGNNKIILCINREDIPFLPKGVKKWTLLECNDNSTIERIKYLFNFEKISKNKVGTTALGSKIYFIKENKVVFQSEIIIENSVSLFFENTGWTFSINYNELINCFSEFSPVYFPIIKIE